MDNEIIYQERNWHLHQLLEATLTEKELWIAFIFGNKRDIKGV